MEWIILVTDCEAILYEKTDRWNGKQKMHLSDIFSKLLHHKVAHEELLILTEKQETVNLANRMHIPVVGLETESSAHLTGTPYILQGIGEESAALLERVYRRYYKLPVVIAETAHLRIREMIESDTESLFRLYHCLDVQNEVDQADLSKEELFAFVESYRRIRYPYYHYGMWILEEKHTGIFVGEAGIEEDSHLDGEEIKSDGICLEAGYVIEPKWRRKGYATEALKGVLEFAKENKETYQFEKISCYIRSENLASIRTAKRCGFIKNRDERYGKKKELEQYSLKL